MKKYLIVVFLLFFSLPIPISSQELITGTIQFQINTDTIIKDSDYNRYINEIVPEIKRRSEEVESISLIGSASPEGNKKRNVELANLRANKIYSYISEVVPKEKITVNSDHGLFLNKTGYDEFTDYTKLRATYIEVKFKDTGEGIAPAESASGSTTNNYYTYNIYIGNEKDNPSQRTSIGRTNNDQLALSVYNSVTEDLLVRPNIGIEVYFSNMSFFLDGSFSTGKFLGKENSIFYWNTGFRRYFNEDFSKFFIELYGHCGYFDTNLFTNVGKYGIFFGGGFGVGYKIRLGKHWKLSPHIRLGILSLRFKDYYTDASDGGIGVSFGTYVDGRTRTDSQTAEQDSKSTGNSIIVNDRTMNTDFFNSCLKGYWLGPTYIGIIIQRDFYIKKKRIDRHEDK